MTYAKHVVDGEARFVRIKRRGTKNCRVVLLTTGEDYLVPRPALEEVSAEEAGVDASAGDEIAEPPTETNLTGEDVCQLMRECQVTIKELAERLGVSDDQVRQARREGVEGSLVVHEWRQAIIGEQKADVEVTDPVAA